MANILKLNYYSIVGSGYVISIKVIKLRNALKWVNIEMNTANKPKF